MTFLVFLTFVAGALASFGVARAAERHRRWTLAMVERRRRRVADALSALERDLWEASGETPPFGLSVAGPAEPPQAPRKIVLRVRE